MNNYYDYSCLLKVCISGLNPLCISINQYIVNFKMTLGPSPLFKLRQEQTERHGYWTSATREPPHLHCQKIVGQYSSHHLLPWFYLDLNNFFSLLNLSVFTILHILMTSPLLLLIWNLFRICTYFYKIYICLTSLKIYTCLHSATSTHPLSLSISVCEM